MKNKLILSGALFLLLPSTALAGTDSKSYETTNGIICKNKWLTARSVDGSEWEALPISQDFKQRTATIFEDKVIVGSSHPTEITDNDGATSIVDAAHIYIFDLATGNYEKMVMLTCNGERITGLLCANQVGTDNYGNLWFAGSNASGRTLPPKVYSIDDINTGACSLVAELPPLSPSVVGDNYPARLDYYDIAGDIKGSKSHAILMSSAQSENLVFRWKREKGSNEWKGDFNGVDTCRISSSYPELTGTNWRASMVSIVDDDSHSGKNFYIDSFQTYPIKYNTNAEIVDGFTPSADPYLFPDNMTNGIIEFSIAGKHFAAYSRTQAFNSTSANVHIAEISDYYSEIQSYWDLASLGSMNDGGTRHHCLDIQKVTDANGKEGVYLLNYKNYNGIGVYLIAEEGFDDQNITGIDRVTGFSTQDRMETARYDIHGRQLSKPVQGINIVRYDNGTVEKQLVK